MQGGDKMIQNEDSQVFSFFFNSVCQSSTGAPQVLKCSEGDAK